MKYLIMTVTLIALVFMFLVVPKPAAALFDDAKNQACQGLTVDNTPPAAPGATPAATNCDQTSANSKVNGILKAAINGFSLVIGVIATIMVIIGGLKYVTSAGDANNVNNAKNTILYAIIGLVVVMLAQTILHFVVNRVNPLPPCPPFKTTLPDGSPCK